jgi:NAD(P)-dependent dehydrogenase (short-subunit alcohol dehydrogenase family)
MGIDVSNEETVKIACEKLLEKHSTIDIFINNAGITPNTLLMRMSDEDWGDAICTNLLAVFIG